MDKDNNKNITVANECHNIATAARKIIDKELIEVSEKEFELAVAAARDAAGNGDFSANYTTDKDCDGYLCPALKRAGFGVAPPRTNEPPFRYTLFW